MKNRQRLSEIVLDYPSLSLDWLAGFVEAEGCFTHYRSSYGRLYPSVDISQNLSDVLYRISDVLEALDIGSNIGGTRTSHLQMRGANLERFVSIVLPRLQGFKREQCLSWCSSFGIRVSNSIVPRVSWDFITGFWEGDGSLHRGTSVLLDFYQKDRLVLDKIALFLGRGTISLRKSGEFCLGVTDLKSDFGLLRKGLLSRAQCQKRRVELVSSLYLDGLI